MPLHTFLVVGHAAAATIALVAGLLAFRFPVLIALHSAAVLAMTAALAGAVIVGASATPPGTTAVFGGLVLIALVMSGQAVLAWTRRPRQPHTPASNACVRAVGFNCVGLVTGFVAVTATSLTTNALLITGASAATVVLGRALLLRST